MVPQTWIVITLFVLGVIFTLTMALVSKFYRMLLFNNSNIQTAYYFIFVIIAAILMMYSTECSVNGRCNSFSWMIAGIALIIFAAHIGYGLYTHFALKSNEDKAQAQ